MKNSQDPASMRAPDDMGKIAIRRAGPEDARFLARVMLMSGRAHVQRGIWEVVLGGPERDVLNFLQRVTVTGPEHLFHYSCFLVAEADGMPVAGLGGYDPAARGYEKLREAVESVRKNMGMGPQGPEAAGRTGRVLSCLPKEVEGAWVIDSVATLPDHRRKGILEKLLAAIMDEGRKKGHPVVQVNIYIGNLPAQRAYEKMGFSVEETRRCRSFMDEIGSPGMMSLTARL
ncbi:GNAT family N-acetyltransferase [Candidatus Moduliflexota bacterium]